MGLKSYLQSLRKRLQKVDELVHKVDNINLKIEGLKAKLDRSMDPASILAANVLVKLNSNNPPNNLNEAEFRVFSQWGDDGIIQYLIDKLEIERQTFVEFGVEDYKESNTRFLLVNNNWSGLVMDGSKSHIQYIKKDKLSWAHDLYAKQAFITSENINGLLTNLPFGQKLGILSIDIDGNDYWVWKAIDVVDADVVIVEYNSCFGPDHLWTIPYQADFVRSRDPEKISYFGASVAALCELAEQKGYDFIGCNSAGNNAYFIKKAINNFFRPLKASEGYVESKFAEGVRENGERIRGKERLEKLRGMPIYNLKTNQVEFI